MLFTTSSGNKVVVSLRCLCLVATTDNVTRTGAQRCSRLCSLHCAAYLYGTVLGTPLCYIGLQYQVPGTLYNLQYM
jgi:hypothetical protein